MTAIFFNSLIVIFMQKQQKPTIAFLTHDWAWGTDPIQPNGCCWYRCKLPSDELNKRGWFTAVGFPAFNEIRGFGMLVDDGRAVHGWDIIILKLLMQKEILESIPKAQAMGQKIIVDIDDWFDGLSKSNKAFETTDPKMNPDSNRDIYSKIIMSADAIITSTPFLFEYYGKKRDNVFMVRNGIDVDRWKKKQFRAVKKTKIGWVGATHWRSNDLEQLSPFMGKYIKQNNVLFHHSGHNPNAPLAHKLLGVSKELSHTTQMAPILSYPKILEPIDIGIIPLNNIEFNHAKSFIKGLEYAAAGIPFIASYSPEYQYLADNGIGRVAKNEKEWIYHLDELLDIRTRRDEINENYSLLHRFSMDARGEDWDSTMKFILENI